jgi:CubicO group peptidase (beta-lactamase class C family)
VTPGDLTASLSARRGLAPSPSIRIGRAIAAFCALGIGVAVGAISTPAPAAAPVDTSAVDILMLRSMATHNVPGAALVLIKAGGIVLQKGYGFRDLATHAPVTVQTLFNIGSISKSFTALAIAQLVDQQKLDLDTPIIRYAPDFRLSDPRVARVVTLRQLLSHTSGLPSDEQWPRQVPPTREGIVSEFATMPINARPGTRFQYCSRCIVLAAYVLERVTDQTWEAYTRTHILGPLGMSTASFGPSGLERTTDGALPYRHELIFGQVQVPWSRLEYLDPLDPAGGIDASAADVTRYALFQLGDGMMSGRRLLSAHMMTELHRPEIAVGSSWTSAPIEDLHYALGWFTAEYRGVRLVYHNGVNPGFRAAIVLIPSAKAGVVILTNGESDRFTMAATLGLFEQLLE